MGLDGVEIVMAVEDAFCIAIEDDDAANALTPRDLIDLVMKKAGYTDRAVCLTQRAFHHLRLALMRRAGVRRNLIKPDTGMASLLPANRRQRLVDDIIGHIGVTSRATLVRSQPLVIGIMGVAIICGVHVISLLWVPLNSASVIVQFLAAWPVAAGLGAAALCGWMGAVLTRPFRNSFPAKLATVGDLSRWIVAHGPHLVGGPPGQWSREQVAARVREIVIDHLGCEKEYREDARFIEDLGMG